MDLPIILVISWGILSNFNLDFVEICLSAPKILSCQQSHHKKTGTLKFENIERKDGITEKGKILGGPDCCHLSTQKQPPEVFCKKRCP